MKTRNSKNSETRLAAQYLRDCYNRKISVTKEALAVKFGCTLHSAAKLFQRAYRLAQIEYGVYFDNVYAHGWQPISHDDIARVSTQKRQRTISSTTHRWGEEIQNCINPNAIKTESGRIEFYAATTKQQIQANLVRKQTQAEIERLAEARRTKPLSVESYTAQTLKALSGMNFG